MLWWSGSAGRWRRFALNARLELLEQLWVLAHLAACPECVASQRLGFRNVLGRLLSRLSRLLQCFIRNCYARLLLQQAGSPVLESRRGADARISPWQLVLHNVGYVVDNVDPPYQGEKRVVFLTILAAARMLIGETRNKELYDGQTFLVVILFLGISLGFKLDVIENARTA